MQHVINAVEMLGLFNGGDVGRFFDDANQPLVAGRAGAINARINVGDVVANRAEAEIGFYILNRRSQSLGIFIA